MPARIAVWYPSFRFVAASVLNTPVVGSQSLDKLASTFADTGHSISSNCMRNLLT
jgi:hypothetical protein